jgi:ribosomal protein S18 acetylase RimI-like enzyme
MDSKFIGVIMGLEFFVRNGKVKDKFQVVDIWNQVMKYHDEISDIDLETRQDAPEIFMKFFENNVRSVNKIALVAEEDRQVIGYMMGAIQKRPPVFKTIHQAILSDAAVHINKRNNGVGEQLLIVFVEWAKKKGMKYIVLDVVPENNIGLNFWKKHGFQTMVLNQRKMLLD